MDRQRILTLLLWTARILGSLILAFVLFFLVAHLFGDEESNAGFSSTRDIISFAFFPIATVLGLALAWKWEGVGGGISTLGFLGLFIVRPDLLQQLQFAMFAVPGILFLTYWLLARSTSKD